jgi:hypothetical protein
LPKDFSPDKESVSLGVTLRLAEVHFAQMVQPRHDINSVPGARGQRGIVSKGTVAQQDVSGL